MKQLNVKVITATNNRDQHDGKPLGTTGPKESEEWDDVINIVIFKGSLMLERYGEETTLIDLVDVIHLSVKPAEDRKVMRG